MKIKFRETENNTITRSKQTLAVGLFTLPSSRCRQQAPLKCTRLHDVTSPSASEKFRKMAYIHRNMGIWYKFKYLAAEYELSTVNAGVLLSQFHKSRILTNCYPQIHLSNYIAYNRTEVATPLVLKHVLS
jgi:hypothetical protein